MRIPRIALLALALSGCLNAPPNSGAAPASAGAPRQAQAYTDAEVAAVLLAIHEQEVETSRAALNRAQDRDVRAYAELMVEHHQAGLQRLNQVLAAAELVPVHNPLSNQLRLNLRPMLAELADVPASRFDEHYVLQQIGAHQFALHTVDTSLIPSARDPQFSAFLVEEVRPGLERHLVEIEALHHRTRAMGS